MMKIAWTRTKNKSYLCYLTGVDGRPIATLSQLRTSSAHPLDDLMGVFDGYLFAWYIG